MIIGALREPGDIIVCSTPYDKSKSTRMLHESCVVVKTSLAISVVFIENLISTPKLAKNYNIAIFQRKFINFVV